MLRLQRTMQYSRSAAATRPFQIIIADNDVPEFAQAEVQLLRLDYGSPLISDTPDAT
jgi:hypothetical protein